MRMRRHAAPRPTRRARLQGPLLHEQFDAVAAARPDAVCLVDDATGVSLTYREVAEAVDTLAAALSNLGVTRDIGGCCRGSGGQGQVAHGWWALQGLCT